MFLNRQDNVVSLLENISLKETNMQPKTERPPACSKAQLPQLHLTPSGAGQKRSDSLTSPPGTINPLLLRPQHDIPATPPPQTRSEFFPQRKG